MNDLRKAAEMALEALEYYRSFEDCQPTPASKTIPALRQALAQPVDAVNISAECVDETVKSEHEPVVIKVTNCDLRKEKNGFINEA